MTKLWPPSSSPALEIRVVFFKKLVAAPDLRGFNRPSKRCHSFFSTLSSYKNTEQIGWLVLQSNIAK